MGVYRKVENKGLELAMNYVQEVGKNWSFDLRGTFTYNRATLIYSDEAYRAEEYRRHDGKSLNGTWGYVAERLFVDQADIDNSPTQKFGNSPMPGDIKYKDMNDDGMKTVPTNANFLLMVQLRASCMASVPPYVTRNLTSVSSSRERHSGKS